MCVAPRTQGERFSLDHSPFMNELLQSDALRHQLRTLAPQSHEGQDGQQVIGAAAGREQTAARPFVYLRFPLLQSDMYKV